MTEDLPVLMVAQLKNLGTALVAIADRHPDARLRVIEEGVLATIRDAQAGLLQVVMAMSTTALRSPQRAWPRDCPTCGVRSRVQSWRPRQLLSVCGTIEFTRPWYVCSDCGHGWSPVDATLEVRPFSRLSSGVSDRLVEMGARTSFVEAATTLEKLTGLSVAPETIRQHTEQRGAALETVQQEHEAQVVRTREPAEPVDVAPGKLVVETDGVMVRYLDGWHEVKLGLVAGYVNTGLVFPSYVAARENAGAFGERLLTEAARRGALEVIRWEGSIQQPGLAILREVAILGDGAVWIWNLAGEHFGERVEIVDFFHAGEHLWNVAKALYGEGTSATKSWAEAQIHLLRDGGATKVLPVLAVLETPTPESADVIRRERGYFRTNEARMDYPRFREQGLPIGSGAVESAAKHIAQQRMKLSGARWSVNGAQAVLNVRCRLASNLPLAS